jgi:acetate kinase
VRLLVVNAGSSSLKLRLLGDGNETVASVDLPAPRDGVDAGALSETVAGFGGIEAVGHRIVHGGTEFSGPVRIDDAVVARLTALTDLAPLHQPKSLAALAATTAALPDAPAVACFDTAFHAGLPAAAATYALPAEWRQRFSLRRFGFHGLAHAYASRRASELLERPIDELRVVTCHLGAGASLAAVAAGRSVDTTMGFTPLEGLVMATRSGTVDPGLVLWLLERGEMSVDDLGNALEHESGLFGLSGTADMREVVARAGAGGDGAGAGGAGADDAGARLALDVYLHRLRSCVASMAAALGGLDVLAFTGGVGERSAEIRAGAAAGLGFLGVAVDAERNQAADGDGEISAAGSAVHTVVIRAREDLEIAGQVRALLERR